MSLAQHREALRQLLSDVTGIGRVHSYERYVRDEAKFRALFTYEPEHIDIGCDAPMGKHVRGWWLRNTRIVERELGVARLLDQYDWQIRGFLSLQDDVATELIFDDLVERLRDAYRANPTLGGINTAETADTNEFGIQKLDASPVLFCGVLCHSATLQLRTQEYL